MASFPGQKGLAPPIQTPVITSTSPLPAAIQNVAYSFQFNAIGGVPPYTWFTTGVGVFSLSASGLLTGSSATTGNFTTTIWCVDSVGTSSLHLPFTLIVNAQTTSPFDFYVGPNGDDNNVGSFASPWSLTALGTIANHTTAACKWSTYAGKRVGLISGNYTKGTYKGVSTNFYDIAESGPVMCIIVNGGPNASNKTYVAGCDSLGNELPGTGTIGPQARFLVGANGGTISPDWQSIFIGNSVLGLSFFPPNIGNCTLGGFSVEGFGGWGVAVGDNAHPDNSNCVTQNVYLTNGLGFHNDNNGGFYMNGQPGGTIKNCLLDNVYSSPQLFKGSVSGYITTTAGVSTLTILSITQGQIFYPTLTTGLVFNGSPTNPNALIGANTLPAGTTFPSPASNQTGSYTLSTNCGNIGSAGAPVPFYIGFPSSSQGQVVGTPYTYGGYGMITFNTNAGTNQSPFNTLNCTFRNINLVDYKTNKQNFNVRYSVFEVGEFGTSGTPITPPLALNAQAVPGGTGNVDHCIAVGAVFVYDNAAPIGNAGAVTKSHNTYYLPPNYNLSPGDVGNCTYDQNVTSGAFTGSSTETDSLFAVLAPGIAGYCIVVAPTVNTVRDHNVYMQGSNPFSLSNSGATLSLAQFQSTYGLDLHSTALSSTPFAAPPASANSASFAITGPAATASSTGGPVGAIDGTGPVGCSFALAITTTSLPTATVGSLYSTTIAVNGGSGQFQLVITACSPNYLSWITDMQNTLPFVIPDLTIDPVNPPQFSATDTITFYAQDTVTGVKTPRVTLPLVVQI